MLRTFRIALGLALFALLATGLAPASTQSARKPASKKARNQPAPAPRPPTPEELPPAPPSVTYRDGQLTIEAHNSTLYDILSAVRKATGAAVDTPASATERVVTRLGPGRPRDVLAALLDGSHFDYILLSSPEDPGGLRRAILAPRSGGGAGAAPDRPGAPASPPETFSQPARPVPARTLPPDSGEGEESVEPAEEVQPEPEPAPPQQPEVKTPEQLQQELRQREEEQRQQQQAPQQEQQTPPAPPPQ